MTIGTAIRWVAFCLLAVCLTAAVLLKGGVIAQQWQWVALGISVAAIPWLAGPGRRPTDAWTRIGFVLQILLLAWMLLPILPLPPSVVKILSADRWTAAMAARAMTGRNAGEWLVLSFAPAATIERLINVLPAVAAFLAAREMGSFCRGRMWLPPTPIIMIAWIESAIGLWQFYRMRSGLAEAGAATGTYVNRNHFAGLLEMALPLVLMAAVWAWNKHRGSATLLAGIAACLLAGVVVSLSRMGFVATILALALMGYVAVAGRSRWRWIVPVALPLCLLLMLPTRELKQRFAYMAASEDVNTDTRVAIWRDTVQLVAAEKWTGTGLGAYERGLYRFKTAKPTNTVDFAHNDYLQVLAELGIPGVLLMAGLVAWVFRGPVRVAFGSRESRNWTLAVGLLGSLVAISIHSLTDFNLYIPANGLALAWLSGLATSAGLTEN